MTSCVTLPPIISPPTCTPVPIHKGLKHAEVSRRLAETIASTSATLESIKKTQSKVAESMARVKDLDDRWKEFQDKFQEVIDKCVADVGKGLGVKGYRTRLKTMEEEGELSKIDKFKVLGYDCSLSSIARRVKSGNYKNVVVLMGAGCSTSAGIPDFRTPGTGLYSKVADWGLPCRESVFDLSYFNNTGPDAFYRIAKEMYPRDEFVPTRAHRFVRCLQDKNVLGKCYTQNIDGLERKAGVGADKLVEAHGSFSGDGMCGICGDGCEEELLRETCTQTESVDEMKSKLRCRKAGCEGYYKPPIVFFGEDLPGKFKANYVKDMQEADLVIVMGTSLQVAPFNNLVNLVRKTVPRLLINRERVGCWIEDSDGEEEEGQDAEKNFRDVVELGDCDAGTLKFAQLLGWQGEMKENIE